MRKRIGTAEYSPAPADVVHAIEHGRILTKAEEAELFEDPSILAQPENHKTRISILINDSNIAFFKKLALQKHMHYQTMINRVLSRYAEHYKDVVGAST
jgi:predicted DNA binding CopG/RHH family protein